MWNDQMAPNKNSFKHQVSNAIIDQSKQNLWSTTKENEKCKNYCVFKHDVNREEYLNTNNEFVLNMLSNFRLGTMAYKLSVMGECKFCENGMSEYHILLECQKLQNLREKYLPKFYCKNPTDFKFNQLMNSSSRVTMNRVSGYLNAVNKLT